ncbi:hypothetical protein RvY_02648 [Ramazzottius varieornatus]|uniref:Uncharacterized protein n=1 Tax=Ramazzottius varieornatus TaxID=947166 RepID=A0A1D1USJ1_RAMVA|nr:hypothetical protein RvY_02648 [Ramazzottius varieornatus]
MCYTGQHSNGLQSNEYFCKQSAIQASVLAASSGENSSFHPPDLPIVKTWIRSGMIKWKGFIVVICHVLLRCQAHDVLQFVFRQRFTQKRCNFLGHSTTILRNQNKPLKQLSFNTVRSR